ncbi:MAG TPA: hypothetical protein VF062_22290 [Candidatus Limnocylindrales bacterium]
MTEQTGEPGVVDIAVLTVVRLLLDGHLQHADATLRHLDAESTYLVLRGMTVLIGTHLQEYTPLPSPRNWPGLAEAEDILAKQVAGDVSGAEFATYLLSVSRDPDARTGAGLFFANGVASLVQSGGLPWPAIHYQLADRN